MRFAHLLLILAVFCLGACSETRYAAHLAKQVTLPTDTPESKGTFKVGTPYKIKGRRYYPKETYSYSETGVASWYGPNFHGKMTANGEIFDKYELTAAHKTLQMPSLVRVTNLDNGKSIILRVNDRGPYAHNRLIDVSQRGAELLDFKNQGTARVRVDVLGNESKKIAQAARMGMDTRGTEIALNQNRVAAPVQYAKTTQRPAPVPTAVTPPVPARSPSRPQPVIDDVTFDTAQVAPQPQAAIQQAFSEPLNTQQKKLFVQAGAFSQENNALLLARQLESFGPSKVYLARINDRPFYRVRLGPYENAQQAGMTLNNLISAGKHDAKIVTEH